MRVEFEKWATAMQDIEPERVTGSFRQPVSVILQEALSVAAFCGRRWKAVRRVDGSVAMPGLEVALYPANVVLKEQMPDEIMSLISAVNHAQFVYELHLHDGGAPGPQGNAYLRELRTLLNWIGEVDASVQKMTRNLAKTHEYEPSSNVDLALALEAYASLAEEVMPKLENAAAFDGTLVARVRAIAVKLRGRGAGSGALSDAAYYALDARNRLLVLLIGRVQMVRAAARFAFRGHPELLQEAASPYNRSRRGAARSKGTASAADESDGAPSQKDTTQGPIS